MENLNSFKGVELIKKANIYFDGNVTSRTFIDVDGSKKSWNYDGWRVCFWNS